MRDWETLIEGIVREIRRNPMPDTDGVPRPGASEQHIAETGK
ncbi:hypothetical protein [Nocardia sp. CC201C]|nr:hypothetical protein [Nocardia sp. CC201C]